MKIRSPRMGRVYNAHQLIALVLLTSIQAFAAKPCEVAHAKSNFIDDCEWALKYLQNENGAPIDVSGNHKICQCTAQNFDVQKGTDESKGCGYSRPYVYQILNQDSVKVKCL